MRYWLIKSEADCYSIADLRRDTIAPWTGIRNYQARNFMRDDMRPGDLALFYHSNGTPAAPSGVYGIARVASAAHDDATRFDATDDHYDPKATREKPIWQCVDMAFVEAFATPVSLGDLRRDSALSGMGVLERGSRLSIMPVSEAHFKYVTQLAGTAPAAAKKALR